MLSKTRAGLKRLILDKLGRDAQELHPQNGDSGRLLVSLKDAMTVCRETLSECALTDATLLKQLTSKSERKDASCELAQDSSEDAVRVSELEETVLAHKVLFHHRFLKPIRSKFRFLQTNDSGFINTLLLDNLFEQISKDVGKLKHDLFDEFGVSKVQFVSFSDVVRVLARNFVEENDRFPTILEKMFQNSS